MIKKYPFKFLDAYEREDRDIFFGREEELTELYRLVFQTNLLLIYGASGTGKTSLIRCGLANRFKPSQWMDLYIRRGTDMNTSLLDTIRKRQPVTPTHTLIPQGEATDWFSNLMETGEKEQATTIDAAPLHSDNPVAQALQELYLATFTPIYLIFDQFEELYTLGTGEEQQQLTRTIAELVELPLPVKIIIVMREEYLARLYDLEKAVPQLRNKKLRIEPMDLPRVEQVILSATARNPQSNIGLESGKENNIARAIIDKVREGDVYVKLPYLQVFMDRLYEQATGEAVDREDEAHFSLALVNGMGDIGDVLADFIEQQSSRLQRKLSQKYKDLPTDIVWQILSPFATVDGTKVPIRQSELPRISQGLSLPDNGQTDELVRETVAELENSRILRYRKEEATYEVAHDTLALQIAEKRSEEEKTYLKARRMVTEGYTTFQDTQTYLNREQLAFIHPYEERLEQDFEAEQWAFLRESERQVKRSEQRRRLIIATIGAILLIAAGIAVWFAVDANKQAAIAKQEKENALSAQERSDSLAQVAEGQRLAALEARDEADDQRLTADSLAQVALAEKDRATQALNELERASDQIAKTLIDDANSLIYELNDSSALEKLRTAVPLQKRAEELSKGFIELAYFYNEMGQYELALGLVDTVLQLRSSGKALQLLRQAQQNSSPRTLINQSLQAVDADWYATLEKRYYPEMVDVPGGAFCMGVLVSPDSCNNPLDTVADFRIARTETTVWQYNLFARATGRTVQKPSWGWAGDNPAVNVSWYDPIAYGNWLSTQQGFDPVYQLDSIPLDANGLYDMSIEWGSVPNWKADGFRLPTEAEWEYAARNVGKDAFDFAGSNVLDAVGWYEGNSDEGFGVRRTHPVARKQPNGLGLYDMSGNVWEWCWEDDNSSVLRGGSWVDVDFDDRCQVLYRDYNSVPGYRSGLNGFRFVQGLPSGL